MASMHHQRASATLWSRLMTQAKCSAEIAWLCWQCSDSYVVNNRIRNWVLTYGYTWVRRSFMTCPASWWDSRFDWSNAQRQDIAAERTAAAVLKMRQNTLKDDRRGASQNVCMHLVRKVWILRQDKGEKATPETISSTHQQQCFDVCFLPATAIVSKTTPTRRKESILWFGLSENGGVVVKHLRRRTSLRKPEGPTWQYFSIFSSEKKFQVVSRLPRAWTIASDNLLLVILWWNLTSLGPVLFY